MLVALPSHAAKGLGAESVLSESQAVALFFERNIDLISAQYQIDRAEAVEWISSAIPNPVLSFGLNELNGTVIGQSASLGSQGLGYNIFLTQVMITAGKRALRMESARFGREAVEADFKDTLRILLNRVRHTFYDLLLAQKGLQVAQANMATFDRIAEANRLREETGDISAIERDRVDVERLKAKGELDLARAAISSRRSDLAKLLNWPERSMDIVVEDSWPTAVGQYLQLKENDLVEKAYEVRPDLKAQELRVQQTGKEAELARRLVVSDLRLSGGYLHDGGNALINSGAIMASAEVPVFYQYRGEVGKAAADFNDAHNSKEQVRNRIRKEVISTYAALNSTAAIVDRFKSMVISRIQRAKDAVEFAYAQGASGLIDLLDAERNYKAMMLEYYKAERDRALAYSDLLMVIGEEPKP